MGCFAAYLTEISAVCFLDFVSYRSLHLNTQRVVWNVFLKKEEEEEEGKSKINISGQENIRNAFRVKVHFKGSWEEAHGLCVFHDF